MVGPSPPTPFDPSHLRLGSTLRRSGIEPTRAPKEWHRVRHGVWVPCAVWRDLTPGQRHAALAHATVLRLDEGTQRVLAARAAAAVWGLPRIEDWPSVVDVVSHSRKESATAGLRPVVGGETESVRVHGLFVTPVARTIVDLARTGSLVSAVAAADHALRHSMCTATELAAEVALVAPRVRGRRAAALVRDLADPRSMSAGESLSRVQMFHLGLPRPALQVRHEDDAGLIGYADFGWDGVAGEFDGRITYRVPPDADPARAGEVVWAEKRREDRMRRKVRVARWVWSTALDAAALGRVLAEVGVRPEARSTWFDLGAGIRRSA